MADRLNNIKSWSVFNACHWSTDHPGDYYYLSKSISAEVVRSWGSCSQGSLPLNWMNFSEISLTALNQPPPHFWNTKHFTTEVFRLGISGACTHRTNSHTIINHHVCTLYHFTISTFFSRSFVGSLLLDDDDEIVGEVSGAHKNRF